MNKQVLAAANFFLRKAYANPDFAGLPTEIRKEVKRLAILTAEKSRGLFALGFYPDGRLFFELTQDESGEASPAAVISAFQEENRELLNRLQLWYQAVYLGKGMA